MKYCSKCGNELVDAAVICPKCGCAAPAAPDTMTNNQKNKTPKCTCCGNIEQWKLGPILRPVDWVIGFVLLFLGIFPGIIYLAIVALVRSSEKNREKICRQCGARNLFTFIY